MNSHFFVANNNKENLSVEEKKTKDTYEKVKHLNIDQDKEAINLLKETINNGVGPYAALAVKMMCDQIDRNTNRFMETSLGRVMETKEKYLSVAKEKNKAIGSYLAVDAYLELIKLALSGMYAVSDDLMDVKKDVLKDYYVMRHLIDADPNSYSILMTEMKNDLEADLKVIKQVDEIGVEEKALLISIAMDEIQKFKNPLDEINKKLNSLQIPTSGPFAKDAEKFANIEIEKLNSEKHATIKPKI